MQLEEASFAALGVQVANDDKRNGYVAPNADSLADDPEKEKLGTNS